MKGLNSASPLRRRVIVITLAAVLGSVSVPVLAQDDGSQRETKQTVAMSQKVYEQLMVIQEQVEAKQYAAAEQGLQAMLAQEKLSPYEVAQIWNLSGYSYYLQENYDRAISSYDQLLKQPELPEALLLSTLKTKAQLLFTVERYQEALTTVEQLMAVVPEPSADVFMLQGQAYFQMGDYRKALDPIKTAVDMNRDQGQTPKENWLLLLRVCYYELGDFPNMVTVLEELIQYYPKDTYLLTLAGAYSELGNTKAQLAIVETLYERGFLKTESHIVNLANLYLLHETPYKAATLLEKEMATDRVKSDERNLRLLSQSWYTAREDEKSIPPLARAADMAGDGELYIRLAQSYINLEKWNEAADALTKGLRMGGLPRTDQANIMLGMAYFNQKKFDSARSAFQNALDDQRSRRTAQQWISYVDSEIKRQELMKQELPKNTQPRQLDELLNQVPEAGG